MSWHMEAACRGMGPDLFYPKTTTTGRGSTLEARWSRAQALSVCSTCTVTEQCLNDALDHGDDWGIWGATTPEDRKALQRIRDRRRKAG